VQPGLSQVPELLPLVLLLASLAQVSGQYRSALLQALGHLVLPN